MKIGIAYLVGGLIALGLRGSNADVISIVVGLASGALAMALAEWFGLKYGGTGK